MERTERLDDLERTEHKHWGPASGGEPDGQTPETIRLPVFDLIDKTVKILNDNRKTLETYADVLQAYFHSALRDHEESLVNISTRVKGDSSLREKILRKNLYKRYAYPEGIIQNLSDLIGVRIQCRFLEEERLLYDALRDRFTQSCADGLYCEPEQPNIRLEMRGVQPQQQNNGYAIYRIDGMCGPVGHAVRFELQIKALVHVFWAEVEHEIIYKNNSYILMDSFMKQMLSSAYDNLRSVDRQLYLIYNQIQNQSEPEDSYLREASVRSLFAKAISDLFFRKMRDSLGFTLNFKRSCDILSRYILARQNPITHQPAQSLMDIFQRINRIAMADIDFEAPLALEAPFRGEEPFLNILADHLMMQMNADYDWNLFFRMLFTLEPGSNLEDFSNLLYMMRDRFCMEEIYEPLREFWSEEQIENFKQWLLVPLAHQLVADGTIQIIYEETFDTIVARLQTVVRDTAAMLRAGNFTPSRYTLWKP